MKFREKIFDFVTGGALTKIQARYEAAYWNMSRSYLPGFIQSARQDVDSMSRQEILRRVRYFEKNSGVALKILQCLETNVIGSGISPSPNWQDAENGKKALAWWKEWTKVADVTERQPYYKLQSIGYRGQIVDGDGMRRYCMSAANRPAIEAVEAHRCTSSGMQVEKLKAQGFEIVDGVVIDSFKRPVAYLISDEFDAAKVTAYPASQINHLISPRRASQYRGITLFHAAVLPLHDLDDLQKYEMRAAKDAAAISKLIKTPAGAVAQDGNGIGASLTQTQTSDPTQRTAYYRQALGGETVVGMPGDDWTQFESKRPSAATSGFWDKLDNLIVQGSKISYAALVDYKGNWSGGSLRAVLQSDNAVYKLETLDQATCAQRDWEYAIGWAIAHGEVPNDPNWKNVRWHPPRRTTVDVGNDSNAMLEELKAGLRTYETIYGETGEDWRERLDQRAQEEAYLKELAAKYDVPSQRIASFAQERLAGMAPDAIGPAPGVPGSPAGKGGGQAAQK